MSLLNVGFCLPVNCESPGLCLSFTVPRQRCVHGCKVKANAYGSDGMMTDCCKRHRDL